MTDDRLVDDGFYGALFDDDPEALYERAPCGYLSTLPDGTIVKVNGTFLDWTGHARTDLVGARRFVDLLTVGGRIYHETHYTPMLQMQGTAREIAVDLVCADGHRLPVLVNSILERDADGAPRIIRTAVFDATERRAYERELLQAKARAEASESRARELAQTLQRTLIPPSPPEIPGLTLSAAYRPAGSGEEVGGDFYDIFEIGPDDWIVAIGDVCGKGVEAALITAVARHTIRAAAVREDCLTGVLHTLNDVLLRNGDDRFCTVALLRLRRRPTAWTLTVSCGGHPLPFLDRLGADPRTVGRAGDLVGVHTKPNFVEIDIVLHVGETVVLYTDGVTEARVGDQFFGDDRLAAAIGTFANGSRPLASALLDEVMAYQGNRPRDDIAIVTVGVP